MNRNPLGKFKKLLAFHAAMARNLANARKTGSIQTAASFKAALISAQVQDSFQQGRRKDSLTDALGHPQAEARMKIKANEDELVPELILDEDEQNLFETMLGIAISYWDGLSKDANLPINFLELAKQEKHLYERKLDELQKEQSKFDEYWREQDAAADDPNDRGQNGVDDPNAESTTL
jgi:hypothetical protein